MTLFQLQAHGLRTTATGIILRVEREPHAIFQPGNAGALHGGHVNKDVTPAVIWRDEAKALVLVEEFDLSGAAHEWVPGPVMGNCQPVRKHLGAIDSRSRCPHQEGMIRPALVLLAACLATAPAFAKPVERSQVIPYPVRGTSAKAIYDDIKKQSPKIASNATFAFTAMATKTDKKEKKLDGSCRYSRFGTSVVYSFVLPKLASTKGVSKKLLAQWTDFAAYLKAHEEWHRDNWRGCIKDYDASALELEAKDCGVLDKKREKLFNSMKRACIAKDEAFDVTFRKEVRNHPFVAEALGEKPKTGGLVSLFKKKK